MVVRTPSLVYIYLSIVSRDKMNENKVFLLSLSLLIVITKNNNLWPLTRPIN